MANIKSAKKRILTSEKARMRNKVVRSTLKTAIKKVEVEIENKNKVEAIACLPNAIKRIDSSVTKGIIHKNKAARTKSRLTKAVNSL
jgi:small subunit ribosomal protein S20